MQTATAAFGTEVISADQTIGYKVLIGLSNAVTSVAPVAVLGDITDAVESISSFYRQITTQTPDTTTLISGIPSAQPEIKCSGMLKLGDGVLPDATKTIYWLFNPYNSLSPLYRTARTGISITIQAGLYDGQSNPELITLFTGTIDQIECDEDGSVTFTCLDRRSTITNQAYLPPVITAAPYNAGLTSEYAVDYLFRHASPAQYLSWPAQRSSCVFSAGFRSSIWPEVGSYSNYPELPSFQPGMFGTALANVVSLVVFQTASAISPNNRINVQFFSVSQGAQFHIDDALTQYQIKIDRFVGILQIWTTSPTGDAGRQTISLASNVEAFIEISVTWPVGSTALSGTIWINGSPTTISVTALDTRANSNYTKIAVVGPMEGLQITTESTYNSAYPFSPTLLIDPSGSLNPLTALPDVSGQDTWGVLQDIAQAEAAVIGFNELGQAFFTNRNTIQTATAARTVTSTTSLMTLASLEQQSLVATHVQMPINPLSIAAGTTVWSASTAMAINPGTYKFTATTQDLVVHVATPDSGFYNPGTANPAFTYWQGCTTADGTGAAITSGITISINQLSATQLQITIVNTTGTVVFLVTPTGSINPSGGSVGSPAFVIGGQPIAASVAGGTTIADAQWPPITSGGAVSNTQFGEVLLAFSNNNWLQDLTTGQALAIYYIEDLFWPKPMVRNVNIVPDARLQNLDRVTLVDTDISGMSQDVLLIGLNMSLSAGVWSQSIDARLWSRPGSWLLGVLGSSELSLTTWIY